LTGLICPWCGATQEEGKFPVLKTVRLSKIIQRGRVCYACGKTFMTEEKALKQTFYKKENERNRISQSA